MDTNSPPDHLTDRSKALWGEMVPRRVDHPETMALLAVALEALDAADRCRRQIASEGLTTKTLGSGTLHRHPLIETEKAYRADFLKAWTSLGLHSAWGKHRKPELQSANDKMLAVMDNLTGG